MSLRKMTLTLPVAALAVTLACSGARNTARCPRFTVERSVATAVRPLASDPNVTFDDLDVIGRAIGDRRIVLVGENGHGVGDFTTWKVRLVKYLHERLGFDTVMFESGFHECGEANERANQDPPAAVLQRCLIVQLHHSELLPLFTYSLESRQSAQPLSIAGIDLQVQSYASRTRPHRYRRELRQIGFSLADTLATLDSVLIEKSFQPADTLRGWLRQHAAPLKALYDSAAATASGDLQWSLLGASELMRRQLVRMDAIAAGSEIPSSYYEIRDEWMARSVARTAVDDTAQPRKVVVWLHNDHARYGQWTQGAVQIRSTGQFLRDRLPEQVFSIGLLMGSGTFADNFRRPRDVAPQDSLGIESVFACAGFPIGWLLVNGGSNSAVSDWANALWSYSRGSARHQMRPVHEFDALVYFDSVSPPSYTIR